MDLTTQGMVAPEGYDPSTKDYKSSVFPTKLQSLKKQLAFPSTTPCSFMVEIFTRLQVLLYRP